METTRARPLLHEPLVPIQPPAEQYRAQERVHDDGILYKLISISRWEAWQIVGGLSNPTKMPCYAWGLPAQACQVGGRLAAVEGSVCQQCYALKGYFRYPKVRNAYQRRLDCFSAADPQKWIEAMVKLVYWQTVETSSPYFRWFDSGDVQSIEMLHRIVAVAARTPEIKHWLPTREYRIIRQYQRRGVPFPSNLIVRVSAPLIDGLTPHQFGLPTSTVHSAPEQCRGLACLAYDSKPANCSECRACWDRSIQNVSYPLH